jgi:HD-GYP domain-containing protein (c-di-GMP phosphodiesterase class II)
MQGWRSLPFYAEYTVPQAYLRSYVATLAALAVAFACTWVYTYGVTLNSRVVIGVLVLALLISLGEAFPVRVSGTVTVGVWDIGVLVAVATLGPTWAAVAALPAAVYAGGREWLRTLFEVSHGTVTIYCAGIVFSLASSPLFTGSPAPPTQIAYATLAAGVVLFAVNTAVVCGVLKVKYGRSFSETWREDVAPYLISDAANLLTAGMCILALDLYGPLAAIVVVAGAVASLTLVYKSREHVRENVELRNKVASLEEALNVSNTAFGTMIVRDLGRRDGYTDRHAAATAVYAADLGRELKLDEVQVGRLRMAGLLHNVGLLGLPEELLVETGKLNSIAQSRLAEHTKRGEEALAAVPEFEEMARWVRWHHERVDGRGYPDKLRGPWIPLEAKILGVAQAYASLVLDQPRRPGLPFSEARQQLCAGTDTEFDGVVVRALVRILDTETEGYRMADDHRFVFPDPIHRGDVAPEPGQVPKGISR